MWEVMPASGVAESQTYARVADAAAGSSRGNLNITLRAG